MCQLFHATHLHGSHTSATLMGINLPFWAGNTPHTDTHMCAWAPQWRCAAHRQRVSSNVVRAKDNCTDVAHSWWEMGTRGAAWVGYSTKLLYTYISVWTIAARDGRKNVEICIYTLCGCLVVVAETRRGVCPIVKRCARANAHCLWGEASCIT